MSNEEQRKYFLSFADSRMKNAAERIKKQAEGMNFFDKILILNEFDIDNSFCNKWKNYFNANVRGFGFWVWKSYIILRLLEQIPENSIILYCDAGCHLNSKGINRLKDYIDMLNSDSLGIKAFEAYSPYLDATEKRWTKGDIFDYFQCRTLKSIVNTAQIQAGYIFIKKCPNSINFVRDWYDIMSDNRNFVDDSRSVSKNLSGFIENRHDQSIFSVLFKLRYGQPLPYGETRIKNELEKEKYPIWETRDKGYKDRRLYFRIKRYLKSIRLRLKIKIIQYKERFF